MKFKVGDKVRMVNNTYDIPLPIDHTGYVLEIRKYDIGVSSERRSNGHKGERKNWERKGWYIKTEDLVLDKSEEFFKTLDSIMKGET